MPSRAQALANRFGRGARVVRHSRSAMMRVFHGREEIFAAELDCMDEHEETQ